LRLKGVPGIPVQGCRSRGRVAPQPILATENIEAITASIRPVLAGAPSLLRVRGHRMQDAGILDGGVSRLVPDDPKHATGRSSSRASALYEATRVTVKRFRRRGATSCCP
jgi:SOS-response transcriptional repressor LexA